MTLLWCVVSEMHTCISGGSAVGPQPALRTLNKFCNSDLIKVFQHMTLYTRYAGDINGKAQRL